jgi:hypothetical protein
MSRQTFREPLYFGCIDRPGHYVWQADGTQARDDRHRWLEILDGLLPPEGPEIEGVARLHHWNGRTLLAFWDRSVDQRGACNSVFALPGKLTFDEAVAAAKKAFPKVWQRFTFEVMPE